MGEKEGLGCFLSTITTYRRNVEVTTEKLT